VAKVPEGVDPHDLNVVARRVLLDALVALRDQSEALTIVGAQAIYLRSPEVGFSAVASYTSDADLSLDPQRLADAPLLEEAMTRAGFVRSVHDHAGSWVRTERVGNTVEDIPVDLLVPDALSAGGRRSVRIPPHDKMAARRVPGLEAAVVDRDPMEVGSLEPETDERVVVANIAGPAALLTAKAYKIHDRVGEVGQRRLTDKDAGDVVRLMMSTAGPDEVAERFRRLLADERTRESARIGLEHLEKLFGAAATVGTEMAVSALAGILDAARVRAIAPAYVAELQAELNPLG
jgi:hypothetical protein